MKKLLTTAAVLATLSAGQCAALTRIMRLTSLTLWP